MELKFKILVLRTLMLILYKLAFPGRDSKDSKDVEALSFEVHKFIKSMDEIQRNGQPNPAEPTPDRPPAGKPPGGGGPSPAHPPLRLQRQL
jgi:hypothetical protein